MPEQLNTIEKLVAENIQEIQIRLFLINLKLIFANDHQLAKHAEAYAKSLAKEFSTHSRLYPHLKKCFQDVILSAHKNFIDHIKLIIHKKVLLNSKSYTKELYKFIRLHCFLKVNKILSPSMLNDISKFLSNSSSGNPFSSVILKKKLTDAFYQHWLPLISWCKEKDKTVSYKSRDYWVEVENKLAKRLAGLFIITFLFLISSALYLKFNPTFTLLGLPAVAISWYILLPVCVAIVIAIFGYAVKVLHYELNSDKLNTFERHELEGLTTLLRNFYDLRVELADEVQKESGPSQTAEPKYTFRLSIPESENNLFLLMQGERLPRNNLLVRTKSKENTKIGKTEATDDKPLASEKDSKDTHDKPVETKNFTIRKLLRDKTLTTIILPNKLVAKELDQVIGPYIEAFKTRQFGETGTCICPVRKNPDYVEIKVKGFDYRLFGVKATVPNKYFNSKNPNEIVFVRFGSHL